MKTNRRTSVFCLALLLLAALFTGSLQAADTVVYKSDFASGKDGWRGREGFGSNDPKPILDEDPDRSGNPVLKVIPDGRFGCGLRFVCPGKFVPGNDYRLSFWIRTTAPNSITGRISTADFAQPGEDVDRWFPVIKNVEREWTEVTYIFAPKQPEIGVEIAVEEKEYDPFEILIKDVKITAK